MTDFTAIADRDDGVNSAVPVTGAATSCYEATSSDIERFIAPLVNIPFVGPIIHRPGLKDKRLPAGITSVRFHDSADGLMIGRIKEGDRSGPLTADDVADALAYHPDYLDKVWVRTTAMPVKDRGVLDLLIDIADIEP